MVEETHFYRMNDSYFMVYFYFKCHCDQLCAALGSLMPCNNNKLKEMVVINGVELHVVRNEINKSDGNIQDIRSLFMNGKCP